MIKSDAWRWPWRHPALLLVVLFGVLATVPAVFSAILVQFAALVAQQGMLAQSNAVLALAGAFFVVFLLAGVFVQALLLGSAHTLSATGSLGLIAMFRNARTAYVRVLLFDVASAVALLPGLALLLSGVLSQSPARVLFAGAGLVWMAAYAVLLVWVPAFLPQAPIRSGVRQAWEAAVRDPLRTLGTVARIALVALAVSVVLLAVLWPTLAQDPPAVRGGVFALSVASFIFAVPLFFPVFLLPGPEGILLQFAVLAVLFAALVSATLLLFSRKPASPQPLEDARKGRKRPARRKKAPAYVTTKEE